MIIIFCMGFLIGLLPGLLAMNSYQNTLIMVAKQGHYEMIKGKWYEIKEAR